MLVRIRISIKDPRLATGYILMSVSKSGVGGAIDSCHTLYVVEVFAQQWLNCFLQK